MHTSCLLEEGMADDRTRKPEDGQTEKTEDRQTAKKRKTDRLIVPRMVRELLQYM